MKQETLSTFLTARTLFEKAGEMCVIDEKYIASAGLIILQDAIELVLYACLKEIGVDEEKNIDKLSFDQMVGEFKIKQKKLPKTDSLKALNKQRVIIKHYGQVADPATVSKYYESATFSVNVLMQDIIGKDLVDILVSEAIKNPIVRECISNASQLIEERDHFRALVEIRKAIFLEIEYEYSVYDWRDVPYGSAIGLLQMAQKGGIKAPLYAKNKEWIEKHVNSPFDYILLDHDKLRIDLLEWGISTIDFWNLWRLTPQVFFDEETSRWRVNQDMKYIRGASTEENARYCLDRAVSLIVKKQNHFDLTRNISHGPDFFFFVLALDDVPLYAKATSLSSTYGQVLKSGSKYRAGALVPGLDGNSDYYQILHIDDDDKKLYFGYAPTNLCKIVSGDD